MKLVVLGGGESGVGAALLGRHLGYEVFLSEKRSRNDETAPGAIWALWA